MSVHSHPARAAGRRRGALVGLLLLPLVLFLAGCPIEERGSPEACQHAVAQDLDAGRFDDALERLASRACAAGMSAEEIEMNRAAAYVGKARYDIADLLLVVLQAERGDDDRSTDLRLLEALTGLGSQGGGLRYLAQANDAYGRMMDVFAGGLDEACRDGNIHLLSRLQRDACFHSGLLAYARLARSFDLLLQNDLATFLGLVPLDCSNDRDFSGVSDEAEISACALHARTRLASGGGACRAPGTRDGLPVGGVTWERITGIDDIPFFEEGEHFATLIPVRVTVEPGGTCEGTREAVRLLQPAARVQMVVTDGYCEAEVTRSCSALDADLGCWPCPVPRTTGTGAVSVTETLLAAVNVEAERWLGVLASEDADRAEVDLEELREALCEPANGSEELECEITDEDSLRVTLDALIEYLRR